MGSEWRAELPDALRGAARVGIEPDHMPPLVRPFVGSQVYEGRIETVTPLLAEMRMIKTPDQLQLARHAGQVANAMMAAGRAAIGDGVPEYEVALATSQAGTRKAAELLAAHYDDADMSPNTHFCRSWPRATRSPKPTTAPLRGSCATANRCSCAFAA
ncbi:hypothetical protein [Marivita cryptomonadis]|uniref:hypothetical protein n=1 Tax=Marivita cryptomonadis TaxID=505252 RepID=UPI003918DF09